MLRQKYLNLSSLPNSSYNDIEEEYIKIINKYNLKNLFYIIYNYSFTPLKYILLIF